MPEAFSVDRPGWGRGEGAGLAMTCHWVKRAQTPAPGWERQNASTKLRTGVPSSLIATRTPEAREVKGKA